MKFQLVFRKFQLVCTPIPERCDWSIQTYWSKGAHVCSYLQTAGVEYFETYDPVVQCPTSCLALTMILSKNWHTKQVDYTNAFYRNHI